MAYVRPVMLALLAASPVVAQERPIEMARLCPTEKPQLAVNREDARMSRLDRLPPAEAYLAVIRREGQCTRPQTVRAYREQSRTR